MQREEVIQAIQELEDKHIKYRDQCGIEDHRTYYSNQAVVIALEDLKSKIKKMT